MLPICWFLSFLKPSSRISAIFHHNISGTFIHKWIGSQSLFFCFQDIKNQVLTTDAWIVQVSQYRRDDKLERFLTKVSISFVTRCFIYNVFRDLAAVPKPPVGLYTANPHGFTNLACSAYLMFVYLRTSEIE